MKVQFTRALLLASTVFMTGAPVAALAQTSGATTPTTAAGAQAADSSTVQEVVVTGSRIARSDLTGAQPVSVLSGQYIQQRGFTNLADAINELPTAALSITPAGDQNDFGTGRNYIDMFGLGSQRTLTLVNGRRFVGDNPTSIFGNEAGNQVDINALPTLFVDRIEEVPATGAAVYGSDAIAGVVNVIMKQKFEGVAANVQAGVSSYGDAPHYTAELAVGHSFLDDKLNVAVDVQWDKTSPLLYSDRPRTASQYAYATNPANTGPNDGIPAKILIENDRWSGLTTGGLPINPNTGGLVYLPGTTTPVQFGKNGDLVAFDPGNVYGPLIGGDASGGDSFNLAPYVALQTPIERRALNFITSYEVSPHVHAHLSLFYSDNSAVEPVNQPNYSAFTFNGGYVPAVGEVYPGLAFTVSADNPFLSSQAKSVLAANGLSQFVLSRANTDFTPDPISSSVKTFDGALSFDGDFDALGRNFTWNVAWTHGYSDSQFHEDGLIFGNPAYGVGNRFGYALDAVMGPNGQPTCRVTADNPGSTNADIANCQPINPFGVGNASAAALAYATADFGNSAHNEQDDLQANLSGSVIRLPAGDLKASIGYERRREAASFTPSAASAEGIGYSVAITGQKGAYHTNEYYGELLVPILGPGFNLPFAEKLELEGAYRKVDNSIAGQNEAWSYGVRFSPVRDITFRGSKSKTFRAPALTELFASGTSAYDYGADPCEADNLTSGPNPAARQANCAAAFAALGANLSTFTNSTVSQQTIPVTAQGNPDLKNEVGDSWTYGVVIQPRWVPGLAITADYMHIDISNAIEFFGVGNLMESCYDSPNYPSAACADFTRDATGQVTSATETYINAGYMHFAGASYSLTYARPIDELPFVHLDRDAGDIGLSFTALNERRLITSASGMGFDAINDAGVIGTPRWRWQSNVSYSRGPFRATWTTHFISKSFYDLTYTIENRNILSVGDYWKHDLSLQYDVNKHVTVRLNINNLFNVEPPFPATGIGTYDLVGRFWELGASAKF